MFRKLRCSWNIVNRRSAAISTFALMSIATVIVTYHWKAQSKTTFNESRVTANILDKARADAITHHKSLMVEFGAGWCSDCLELSKALEQPVLRDLLKTHFVVLNVDVGQFNRNIDIALSLGVDVNEGIPRAEVA